MQATVLIAILAIAAPVRTPRDAVAAEPRSLADQLLGEWQAVRSTHSGALEAEREVTITFVRGKIQVRENGATSEYAYRLNPGSTACIDIVDQQESGERVIPAIVALQAGQLTLCFPKGGHGERPSAFASPPQSGIALVVFRRTR